MKDTKTDVPTGFSHLLGQKLEKLAHVNLQQSYYALAYPLVLLREENFEVDTGTLDPRLDYKRAPGRRPLFIL